MSWSYIYTTKYTRVTRSQSHLSGIIVLDLYFKFRVMSVHSSRVMRGPECSDKTNTMPRQLMAWLLALLCHRQTWHTLFRFYMDSLIEDFYNSGLFQLKMPSFQHRNFDYKDKTVSRPSYLYNGNSYVWKYSLFIGMGLWVKSTSRNDINCWKILIFQPKDSIRTWLTTKASGPFY